MHLPSRAMIPRQASHHARNAPPKTHAIVCDVVSARPRARIASPGSGAMLGAVGVRAPEGLWQGVGDRRPSSSFNPDCPSHCVMCKLPGRRDSLAVMNAGRALLLGTMAGEWKALELGQASAPGSSSAAASGPVVHPSCLDFTPESGDGHDLLVGMSSGEIMLFSLAALAGLAPGARPCPAATYNDGAAAVHSRCLSLQWIQGTAGGSFVATHADGGVAVYHRVRSAGFCAADAECRLFERDQMNVCMRVRVYFLGGKGGGCV